MKSYRWLLIGWLLATRAVFAQGPLQPPGAPGETMKSLDQIEARTPITALPFTIAESGSYYLTGNLSGTTGIVATGNNNFIARNTASSNTLNWEIAAGNVCLVVQAVTGSAISGDSGGTSPGSTNPNANFTH